MKINKIIKTKRIAKQMTQEQLASYLHVSAPAVNKWEKGISYPDITLLPILARVLDTDLNTLLSFQEDLSDQEIASFSNQLSEIADQEGWEQAYTCAMEKVKEFPNSDRLLLHVALTLDGASVLLQEQIQKKHRDAIDALYHQCLNSHDESVKHMAQNHIILKYINEKAYKKAESLIASLPNYDIVDKKFSYAKLWMAQGKYLEAKKTLEEKLILLSQDLLATFHLLIDAMQEDDCEEDAKYILQAYEKICTALDLWDYQRYVLSFQYYVKNKDIDHTLDTLSSMFDAINTSWDTSSSPLYRHIKQKEIDPTFASKMKQGILASGLQDESLSFLKDCDAFQTLLKDNAA